MVANAFAKGLNTIKARRGQDQKLIESASKDLQEAFLRARIASADTKPSQLLDEGSAGVTFMTKKRQIGDTGLSRLYESLDAIY